MTASELHLTQLELALHRARTDLERVHEWGCRLGLCLAAGSRLLAAGNGGSAAQAQHLTAELVGRYRAERVPLSAICLSAETSSLTALCNDYPPGELFARQVEAHGRAGDVLVVLSTSGRSPNVLEAAHRGRRAGLTVWAMTGAAPNPLSDAADDVLAVDGSTTAAVQEVHLVALHVLCEGVDAALERRHVTALRHGGVGPLGAVR